QCASWLVCVVPFAGPVVLLVGVERVLEAVGLARRIGYDNVLGWLDGGVESWVAAGLQTASLEVVTAEEARVRADDGAQLLDVRQRSEWGRSRSPGARGVELGVIISGRPAAGELLACCVYGDGSATAACLLARR